MMKYCLEKWEKNKAFLEGVLRNRSDLNDCSYKDLVKLVVWCILNAGDEDRQWSVERITEIDDGDYQGTLLYLIPADSYQPDETEYLMTYVGYGSCSGCDTLQGIQDYETKELTESQVKSFMALCKDLVCNMTKHNLGWRYDEGFETIESL